MIFLQKKFKNDRNSLVSQEWFSMLDEHKMAGDFS